MDSPSSIDRTFFHSISRSSFFPQHNENEWPRGPKNIPTSSSIYIIIVIIASTFAAPAAATIVNVVSSVAKQW